jgi:probable rRNA maturation factor
MVIDIRNLQDKIEVDEKEIKKCASAVLEDMGEKGSELSLLLVSDARIKVLNRKYRDKNSSTDVLAFAMRSGEGVSGQSPILGDVVISVETADREAAKRKISLKREICLYVVHGILHLLGYDDEDSAARKKMKAKQDELMRLYETAKPDRKF